MNLIRAVAYVHYMIFDIYLQSDIRYAKRKPNLWDLRFSEGEIFIWSRMAVVG